MLLFRRPETGKSEQLIIHSISHGMEQATGAAGYLLENVTALCEVKTQRNGNDWFQLDYKAQEG